VPRAPRNTLNRDLIAAAALDLMDAEALGGLTVRALAGRLGVAPMALYNHVATKDDILDAARGYGLSRLPAADPGPPESWWSRLRAINIAFHTALRDHPSLATLVAARPLEAQGALVAAEAQLRVLVEAGFEATVAVQAHLSLLQYSLGAAVWTAPRVGERGARKALAALPTDRYATMVSLAVELADACPVGCAPTGEPLPAVFEGAAVRATDRDARVVPRFVPGDVGFSVAVEVAAAADFPGGVGVGQ